MWIYPKCEATNFVKGPCECCGYAGEYIITPYTQELSGTSNPLPPLPNITC